MSRLTPHGNDCLASKPIYSMAVDGLDAFPDGFELGTPHFVCFLAMDARRVSDVEIRSLGRKLLDLGCTYFCFWGPDCERVHDQVDQADLERQPEGPWATTTWHSNEPLATGLWFALNSACPGPAFENELHSVIAISVGSQKWSSKITRALRDTSVFNKAGHIAKDRTRKRGWYLLAAIATLALGLTSRRYPGLFPAMLGKYPGDALWALMVFFAWGAVLPAASGLRLAVLALATSFGVEFLKLYQAPWIVSLRHATLGHLVFGHGFSWQNLVAYGVGVVVGVVIEWGSHRRRNQRSNRGDI